MSTRQTSTVLHYTMDSIDEIFRDWNEMDQKSKYKFSTKSIPDVISERKWFALTAKQVKDTGVNSETHH